ncbi:MAG: hypothetical protein QOF58_835 [Pseudonocardiales bacterium]|nr:hypothetical protein [Pseudonocardiales bacterium]
MKPAPTARVPSAPLFLSGAAPLSNSRLVPAYARLPPFRPLRQSPAEARASSASKRQSAAPRRQRDLGRLYVGHVIEASAKPIQHLAGTAHKPERAVEGCDHDVGFGDQGGVALIARREAVPRMVANEEAVNDLLERCGESLKFGERQMQSSRRLLDLALDAENIEVRAFGRKGLGEVENHPVKFVCLGAESSEHIGRVEEHAARRIGNPNNARHGYTVRREATVAFALTAPTVDVWVALLLSMEAVA